MNVTEIRDLCLEAERLYAEGHVLEARSQAAAAVHAARSEPGHYALGLALTTAGLLAAEVDDHETARAAFAEAVRIARTVRAEDPEHAYAIFRHAAAFLRAEGEPEPAARLEDESLATLGDSVGTEHLRYYQLKAKLGELRA